MRQLKTSILQSLADERIGFAKYLRRMEAASWEGSGVLVSNHTSAHRRRPAHRPRLTAPTGS
jgi:hypothetical protein